MADTTQVNMRYPNILLVLIDAAAGDTGRTKWILEACRMRLDGVAQMVRAPERAVESVKETPARKPEVAGSNPAVIHQNPDMQALRDRLLWKEIDRQARIPSPITPPLDPITDSTNTVIEHIYEIPICGKTWWEDGDLWECLMDQWHPEGLKQGKHGLRGMVRAITP